MDVILALRASWRKTRALAATRMLEDVGETRVTVLGRAVVVSLRQAPLRG